MRCTPCLQEWKLNLLRQTGQHWPSTSSAVLQPVSGHFCFSQTTSPDWQQQQTHSIYMKLRRKSTFIRRGILFLQISINKPILRHSKNSCNGLKLTVIRRYVRFRPLIINANLKLYPYPYSYRTSNAIERCDFRNGVGLKYSFLLSYPLLSIFPYFRSSDSDLSINRYYWLVTESPLSNPVLCHWKPIIAFELVI